jgi:acyl-CoA hydrolase
MKNDFIFNNSILIKPEDLNPVGNLFGGRILEHIDEKAALFCHCQLNYSGIIVTKLISEIDFVSSATNGDIVEFGFRTISVGRSSITIECIVQNKTTGQIIIKIDKMVFVNVNKKTLKSEPHGFTIDTIGKY